MPSTPIDIIIPVYLGDLQTRRCIESVLRSTGKRAFRAIVIDDASPETGLLEWLRQLAEANHITLFSNPSNLGFVRSIRLGMEAHPDRDAVLLNSDCEVSGDWLDRLVACVDADPKIATATPFSNNATICSYPLIGRSNDLPGGWPLADLDKLFAQVNSGKSIEIPTAVGSCMYLRRACWDALDGFDAETFGHGYGEECDFSMRAAALGWKNVLCADVFVFHEGSVSFGNERATRTETAERLVLARHPSYGELVTRFMNDDPASRLRNDVSRARLQRSGSDAERVIDEIIVASEISRSSLVSQLTHTHKELANCEKACATLEAAVADARAHGNELAGALIHAENFVREREIEIERLDAQLEKCESFVRERERDVTELKAGLVNLEQAFNETTHKLVSNIRSLEGALTSAEDFVRARESEVAQLAEDLNRVESAYMQAERFVRQREADVEQTARERDQATMEFEQLHLRFNRTLEQRVLRQITKLLRVLKLR